MKYKLNQVGLRFQTSLGIDAQLIYYLHVNVVEKFEHE